MSHYQPSLTLTPRMLALVADISEQGGSLPALRDTTLTRQLRRGNRIRTIQASLAIENNSLSVEQVTAVLEGKRVLGLPREIQEVRNTFAAYEVMPEWQPAARADLLQAHGLLMRGLIEMTDPASPRSPVQKYRLIDYSGDALSASMAMEAVRQAEQLMQRVERWPREHNVELLP